MHVIAEAGNNHNGDLETALALVDAAVAAGADSVKFQLINPEGLYLPAFPTADGYVENEVIAARRAHMLSPDDYAAIAAHCAEREIAFSASAFDEEGIRLLDRLEAPYIKIASCDLDNARLIRAATATGRRVVLSTGMATLEEVEETLAAVGDADLVLLHCVSVYPASLEQMNLGFISELARFGHPVGLSDHTPDPVAAAMAVSYGATWFEKHLTLDRDQAGFDHAYAREPEELTAYVTTLRQAAAAAAAPGEKVGPAEREVAERSRRAIYAARDLEAGDTVGAEDVVVVRPRGPLRAADADAVIGRTLLAPLRRYEPLTWDHVGGPRG